LSELTDIFAKLAEWVIPQNPLGEYPPGSRDIWDKRPLNGLVWCFGASLSRLLRVIEINKKSRKVFNDLKLEQLYRLQSTLFAG
jgi:hypothetical protein